MSKSFTENELKNFSGLFSPIDIYFARFIVRFSDGWDSDIFLSAALLSRATANGDICLDLNSVTDRVSFDSKDGVDELTCPPLLKWLEKLYSNPAVGKPGDRCPLILDDQNRLYLHRYWEYEKKLVDSIRARVMREAPEFNPQCVKGVLTRLFPESRNQEFDWQKVAAIIVMLKRFSVITGGPGSGKTYTIARILALILECTPKEKLNIYLTAPTGKAAARLGETIVQTKQHLDCSDQIKDAIPSEVYTIHRLLKPIAGTPYFQTNPDNPLRADVVVVDEASMVDLALMSKLVQSIPTNARVLLVGDKDQLASVEAGSVLGDICDREIIHGFSKSFVEKFETLSGTKLEDTVQVSKSEPGLQDCICVLTRSYRFSTQSGIGGLSRAINHGNVSAALSLMKDSSETSIAWNEVSSSTPKLARMIIEGYRKYLTIKDPMLAMKEFNRFKILCALKVGPYGANAINNLAEQILSRENLISRNYGDDHIWYKGRPVLITKNDYNLGLYNGDIGITMPDPNTTGEDLHVYFQVGSGDIRRIPTHRLPEHETVYAMTIHKSQGSEFDRVVLVFPDKDYPILTRELFYTGLTRARQNAWIWGTEAVLNNAIARKIERTSGLREGLWKEQ